MDGAGGQTIAGRGPGPKVPIADQIADLQSTVLVRSQVLGAMRGAGLDPCAGEDYRLACARAALATLQLVERHADDFRALVLRAGAYPGAHRS